MTDLCNSQNALTMIFLHAKLFTFKFYVGKQISTPTVPVDFLIKEGHVVFSSAYNACTFSLSVYLLFLSVGPLKACSADTAGAWTN